MFLCLSVCAEQQTDIRDSITGLCSVWTLPAGLWVHSILHPIEIPIRCLELDLLHYLTNCEIQPWPQSKWVISNADKLSTDTVYIIIPYTYIKYILLSLVCRLKLTETIFNFQMWLHRLDFNKPARSVHSPFQVSSLNSMFVFSPVAPLADCQKNRRWRISNSRGHYQEIWTEVNPDKGGLALFCVLGHALFVRGKRETYCLLGDGCTYSWGVLIKFRCEEALWSLLQQLTTTFTLWFINCTCRNLTEKY